MQRRVIRPVNSRQRFFQDNSFEHAFPRKPVNRIAPQISVADTVPESYGSRLDSAHSADNKDIYLLRQNRIKDKIQMKSLDDYGPRLYNINLLRIVDTSNIGTQTIYTQGAWGVQLPKRIFPVSLNLGAKYSGLQNLSRKRSPKGRSSQDLRHRISIRTGKGRTIHISHVSGGRGVSRISIGTGINKNKRYHTRTSANRAPRLQQSQTSLPKIESVVAKVQKTDSARRTNTQNVNETNNHMNINDATNSSAKTSSVHNVNTTKQNAVPTKLIKDNQSSQIAGTTNDAKAQTDKASLTVTKSINKNVNVSFTSVVAEKTKSQHMPPKPLQSGRIIGLKKELHMHATQTAPTKTGSSDIFTEELDLPDGPDGPDVPDGSDAPDSS